MVLVATASRRSHRRDRQVLVSPAPPRGRCTRQTTSHLSIKQNSDLWRDSSDWVVHICVHSQRTRSQRFYVMHLKRFEQSWGLDIVLRTNLSLSLLFTYTTLAPLHHGNVTTSLHSLPSLPSFCVSILSNSVLKTTSVLHHKFPCWSSKKKLIMDTFTQTMLYQMPACPTTHLPARPPAYLCMCYPAYPSYLTCTWW